MIIDPTGHATVPMPLDRSTIRTSFPIAEQIITDPHTFRNERGLELRVSEPKSAHAGDDEHLSRTLLIGTCGGVSVDVGRPPCGRWAATQIHVNPGKILYGHNGRALNEIEVITALSLALELVAPLLELPGDWINILPGITIAGKAHWSRLEIPLHLHDPDGAVEHVFRNPRHPEIKKPALRADGESVKLGSGRAQLQINVYRKDLESKNLLANHNAPTPARILRIEATLKGEKLVDAIKGNGTTREIAGILKVVRFTGPDLVAAHRAKMLKLEGCCHGSGDASELPGDNILGRFMAHVCHRHGLVLDDLISICRERFAISRNTESRHRCAALDELSRLSPFSAEDIFSSGAYENQPSIRVPRLENLLKARREHAAINPLVAAAYGTMAPEAYRDAHLS
jgi:hypothetical protein